MAEGSGKKKGAPSSAGKKKNYRASYGAYRKGPNKGRRALKLVKDAFRYFTWSLRQEEKARRIADISDRKLIASLRDAKQKTAKDDKARVVLEKGLITFDQAYKQNLHTIFKQL